LVDPDGRELKIVSAVSKGMVLSCKFPPDPT